MVKLSNKGKGKPSKRKTLKTKYKIERKVKAHKKKLRKQLRKLGDKNIKPKKGDKTNTLPNSFPFKAQILQHFKNQIPVEISALTQKLIPAEWGLIALENRSVYLPKDKDHLTKKYITNYDKIWEYANVIIEVADARNFQICLSQKIAKQCVNRNIKHIIIVTKIDTLSQKRITLLKKTLSEKYQNSFALFSNQSKRKNGLLQQILAKLKDIREGQKNCVVVGKANTGKHTLIKQFMKLAKFHNDDYATLNDVIVNDNLHMLDAPYKVEDETNYPLFHVPLSVHEDSIAVQEDKLFKYLFVDHLKNRNEFLMHYGIQDFISIDDLLKKIGKANRIFGKGGMVNTGAVRTTVLTDWFYGKLNHIFD